MLCDYCDGRGIIRRRMVGRRIAIMCGPCHRIKAHHHRKIKYRYKLPPNERLFPKVVRS